MVNKRTSQIMLNSINKVNGRWQKLVVTRQIQKNILETLLINPDPSAMLSEMRFQDVAFRRADFCGD
jgi:hypothetical protein